MITTCDTFLVITNTCSVSANNIALLFPQVSMAILLT